MTHCPECRIVPYACQQCGGLKCRCIMPQGVFTHWNPETEEPYVKERRMKRVREPMLPFGRES